MLFGVTNPTAPHDWPQTTPILDGLTNPAPFRVVVFRVHSNRQGLHHRSCSHACCGHGMEMFTRSSVLTYPFSYSPRRPPWGTSLLWLSFLAGFSESQGSGAPLVRCPSCYGARSYPSRRVRQMTCLSNPMEISKNRRTLYSSARVGVALSRGVSPSDTNNLVTMSGMTSGAVWM
jgi:hypothetical protein